MRSPATKTMVYPFHLHLPLFWKRQVLVNFCPYCICVLSGTVTSSSRMALSLQEAAPESIPLGVPGVVVSDASGVCEVPGVSVGRAKPDFVGGRVEVIKRAGVGSTSCFETLIQEVRL